MNRKNQRRIQVAITVIGALLIVLIAFFCYRAVKDTIVHREQENIKSVTQISARDLEASLGARRERMYAALSGDMQGEDDIEKSILKIKEKGRYIRAEESEECEPWQKECCEKAGNMPGEVYVGPIRENGQGNYVLYMTKAVYMERSLAGYVQIELDLDEIFEDEKALSELNIGNNSYVLVKDLKGTTIMGNDQKSKDISFSGGVREDGVEIFWSYKVTAGAPKRSQKLVAYDTVNFGDVQMILCVVEDYDEVIKPIDHIAVYLMLLALALLLWVGAFGYRILKQKKEEEQLKLALAHEKELNEANHALENQENLMQKYNHSKTTAVLTGALAHEFNNLMTPIVLYSDLLAENEVVEKEMPDEVHELQVAAVRCEELAKQLLDYNRQGRMQKVLTNYNATFAVESSVGIVSRIFPENIKLETSICKTSHYICGQIGTLNQIILNLVTNAIQAIGTEQGVIKISFGLSKENDRYVRLIVEDNGPGMPKELLHHIFDPFFSTKKEKEGSGIGLTVVKRLVEEHGGDIRVSSKEGEGTTFIMDFPKVEEA